MTEPELVVLSKTLADLVLDVVRTSTTEIRERVVGLETKQAVVSPEVDAMRDVVRTLEMRLAAVEVREPLPGPVGPAGPPGADGKDGTPGLRYCGVWVEGKTYDTGDLATWGGSTWHCNATETRSKPGDESKAWTMMVKAGRDVGRDTRERGK
jgi:hypothetical protein